VDVESGARLLPHRGRGPVGRRRRSAARLERQAQWITRSRRLKRILKNASKMFFPAVEK